MSCQNERFPVVPNLVQAVPERSSRLGIHATRIEKKQINNELNRTDTNHKKTV